MIAELADEAISLASIGALVLGKHGAGPEEINVAPLAGEFFHGFLEGGDGAALDAEDHEEGIPKGLGLGVFAGLGGPCFGEGDGAVFDFIP